MFTFARRCTHGRRTSVGLDSRGRAVLWVPHRHPRLPRIHATRTRNLSREVLRARLAPVPRNSRCRRERGSRPCGSRAPTLARLVASDPLPTTFTLLERNLSSNGIDAELIDAALGSADQTIAAHYDAAGSAHSSTRTGGPWLTNRRACRCAGFRNWFRVASTS